jgi:branched-chain amino acid transport system ATP-binding protein
MIEVKRATNKLFPKNWYQGIDCSVILLILIGEIRSEYKKYSPRIEDLITVRDEIATDLPYGQQKKVGIARALALQPQTLLLDEPAAGLNTRETDELVQEILRIKKEFDLSIILVEHDMKVIMGICERIIVMDEGVIIAEGTPREVQNNEDVINAYLGINQ